MLRPGRSSARTETATTMPAANTSSTPARRRMRARSSQPDGARHEQQPRLHEERLPVGAVPEVREMQKLPPGTHDPGRGEEERTAERE